MATFYLGMATLFLGMATFYLELATNSGGARIKIGFSQNAQF